MKVQKIANTSIFTRKNDNSTTVSFAGKQKASGRNSMPGFSAKLAENAKKKPETGFGELSRMAKDFKNAVKSSFERSEINQAVVKPMKAGLKGFSKKAPTITKGIKFAAVVGVSVGLFEAVKGKISE